MILDCLGGNESCRDARNQRYHSKSGVRRSILSENAQQMSGEQHHKKDTIQ